MKRFLGPGPLFFLALLVLLLAGGRSRFFRDPGTFWHVTTGDILLDTRQFLDHDPYTFTFGGSEWTPYEWLGEVGMALLHRTAGFDGLLLYACTVIAATFAWLAVRLLRTGLHVSLVACVVGLAVAASANHFHVRPHLLTLLFLAATVVRLRDYETGRCGVGGLLWLVPLFVVWTSVHGGVLGGIGTVGLAVAGWGGFRLVGWPSPVRGWRDFLGLCGVVAGCGLAVLVNPYGLKLPETWLRIMRMGELPRIIQEHAPIDPADPASWAFFLYGGLYLAVLLGLRQKPRVTWLLPLVWFALGCDRVRHTPLFVVTATVALADLFPRTVWAKRLAGRPDLYRPRKADDTNGGRVWWVVPAVAVLAVFGLQVARVEAPVVGRGWAKLDPTVWPVELADAINAQVADRPAGVPVFNEYAQGGFLIYFAPKYRPFVDDRCEVFGGKWLEDFVRAESVDTAGAMARWEGQYGRFPFALSKAGSGFDRYFRSRPNEWAVVRDTATATFYRRK